MNHATTRHRLAGMLAVLGTLAVSAAYATELRVDRVSAAGVVAEDLRVAAVAAADTRTASLTVTVARLDLGIPAAAWQDLQFACGLQLEADERWRCEGRLRARRDGKLARGRLRIGQDAQGRYARLSAGEARVDARLLDPHTAIEWRKLPLDWLAATIASVLPALRAVVGEVDGTAKLVDTPRGWAADGTLMALATGFDSPQGTIAASGLELDTRWRLTSAGDRFEIAVDARALAGEALYSPVYVLIPASGVQTSLTLARVGTAPWRIDAWSIDDAGVLSANGKADLNADGGLASIDVERLRAELASALPRYAAGPLAQFGLDRLEARGTLEASLRWPGSGAPTGHAELRTESLTDAAGRFAFEGLEASLSIAEPGTPPSRVDWRGAHVYRVPVGAASVRFQHDGTRIALLEPTTLPIADGKLVIESAERTQTDAIASWSGALRVEQVALAPLTEAFGWPRFAGTLSGRVPSLRGSGSRVTLDGELEAQLFDGRARVSQLAIERLFGVAPSLAADLSFEDLDLGMVTGAFDFGSIEGRLDGRIADLRLVDWSPVAFDAAFRTDREHDGKRRISQRAVNNLSAVGGGAAGIQRGVLKFFDSFGYAEIGLACRLADNICTMGGLDSENGGYTIVRGSGLPHLTVVGHQRRVDWPVLVARMKAAIAGGALDIR